MPVDLLPDTPVRHDEDSITKTSHFCRSNWPQNKIKVVKAKANIIEEIKVKKKAAVIQNYKKNQVKTKSMLSQTVTDYIAEPSMDEAISSNSTANNISVIHCGNGMDISAIPSVPDISESIMELENEILRQRHSTPGDVKAERSTAVSSTPNLEILNTSRLRRSVASQTCFTLNARDICGFPENMRSYFGEVVTEQSQIVSSFSQTSPDGMTSPLRALYAIKLSQIKTPVESKMKNIRKLSLRSRTMISSAMEKSKDMLPRHKSLEEKRLISNTFSLLPNPKTPPPSSVAETTVHNPFEADLSERLGKAIFSPDVFDNVLSPSEDSGHLRWTIEDISSINPVQIDEDFTVHADDEDPEKENLVQQEIERYFSETHLVLSPDEIFQPSQYTNLMNHPCATASTPQKAISLSWTDKKCVGSQTVLSFPEILPDEIEDSLRHFFKLFDGDDLNLSASNLRRKLFFHYEDEPLSPVRFDICPGSWDYDNSPYSEAKNNRHFTPVANQGVLSSPEMSPVLHKRAALGLENKIIPNCKKTLHHYFPESIQQGEDDIFGGAARMHCTNCEMAMDSDSAPSSQDTGYHTEESWHQPVSIMASTPSRH